MIELVSVGPFGDQFNTDAIVQNFIYATACIATVLVILGLSLIDVGLSRKASALHVALQKFIVFAIGASSCMIVGVAIWQWQYNRAFGVANALQQSLKDWWIGGNLVGVNATEVDPALTAGLGNSQVFFAWIAVYGGMVCALIHTAVSERIRNVPMYVISAVVGGLLYPVVLFLTWGSTSPLTNSGMHDFLGVFPAYIFAGAFGLVLTLKLGPRAGLFSQASDGSTWTPNNVPMALFGVIILMFTAPFVAMGCGVFVPGDGYYGVSMTTSSLGVMFINIFVAFAVGGVVGGLIAHRTNNSVHAILGPLAGLIVNGTALDVLKPWETALLAVVGPLVVFVTYEGLRSRSVDDPKLAPLASAGITGAVLTGIVSWGTPTGGYFGLDGTYGFQNANINVWWQILGVAVTVAIAVVSALVLLTVLGRFTELRTSDDDEVAGLDVLWAGTSKR